jgi:hypothetical protein
MFQEASRATKPTYLDINLRNIRVLLIVDFDDVDSGRFEILLEVFALP